MNAMELSEFWRWGVLGGIATMLLGVIVLAWPDETLLVVAVLFGMQLIIWGLVLVVSRAMQSESAGQMILGIIAGVLAILLGLATFRVPGRTLALVALFLGAAWLVSGMMEAVEGVVNPDLDQRGWHIVVGIVTALAGIVVIGAPFGSLFTLTVVGGVLMIVVGFVRCLEAFWLRSMRVT